VTSPGSQFNHDYDQGDAVLKIDPDSLHQSGQDLKSLSDQVADHIKHINDTVFGLELLWAGKTAGEAQDFLDQWNGVMTKMYGSANNPEDGVLNVMAGGVEAAAVAHGNVNFQIYSSFVNFQAALNGVSGGGGAPQDHYGDGPVWEVFPRDDSGNSTTLGLPIPQE
jgi:uncharacterized protein YukE